MNMPIAIVCLQNRRGNVAPISKAPEDRALFLRAHLTTIFFIDARLGCLACDGGAILITTSVLLISLMLQIWMTLMATNVVGCVLTVLS